VEALKAKGVRAIAIHSDQADLNAARPLIDGVIAAFGKLDILVNNAAIAIQGQLVDDPALDTETTIGNDRSMSWAQLPMLARPHPG